MAHPRVKSSVYLSAEMHEQLKAYSSATSLALNTHIVLALQEYLQRKDRQAIIDKKLHQRMQG